MLMLRDGFTSLVMQSKERNLINNKDKQGDAKMRILQYERGKIKACVCLIEDLTMRKEKVRGFQ